MLLRLSCWLALALSIITSVHGTALLKRDADFESVRTRLKKDYSGRRGDPVAKYFREYLQLGMGDALLLTVLVYR